MDIVPYQLIRAIFLILAFLSIIVALSIWWFMRKKSDKWRKLYLIETEVVVFVILLGFGVFSGVAFSGALTYPLFAETMGPGGTSHLDASSALSFLTNMDRFEQVEDIAAPVTVPVAELSEQPKHHEFTLTAKEVLAEVAPGISFNYWTYDGKVPGPILRVQEGDTVTITLKNDANNMHVHSLDLHAVNGPGGGAEVLKVAPGESVDYTFTATHAGVYVYHCAGGANTKGAHQSYGHSAASHMAHGQYGLIIVDPKGGLPEVDHEFYVMQGEIYTTGRIGDKGLQAFDSKNMLDGLPTYVVFNGRVGGVQELNAQVGDTVRFYVGNGGVSLISSFHIIGEIFDKVYPEASLSDMRENVQTTIVPAGGATVVEMTLDKPGSYLLVDHALSRVEKGAYGVLEVMEEEHEQ